MSDDSFLYLMDNSVSFSNEELPLPDTSVADLISHLLGTPVMNPQTSRTSFPTSNIFQKDRANLLVVLESVGSGLIAILHVCLYEHLDLLAQIPELKVLKQSGQKFKLNKSFYPEDAVASLTTLFTGYGPSVHGVVSQ